MENSRIFICECHSYTHQTVFWYDTDDKQLYLTVHLINHKSFWKRLWAGIKYICGYTSAYGEWDEFIFKQSDEHELYSYLKHTVLTYDNKLGLFSEKIKTLIEEEENHIQWLLNKKHENPKAIQEMINVATKILNHYKTRYFEYLEFTNKK